MATSCGHEAAHVDEPAMTVSGKELVSVAHGKAAESGPGRITGARVAIMTKCAQDWPLTRSERLSRLLELYRLEMDYSGMEAPTTPVELATEPCGMGTKEALDDAIPSPLLDSRPDEKGQEVHPDPNLGSSDFVLVHRSYLDSLLSVSTPLSNETSKKHEK